MRGKRDSKPRIVKFTQNDLLERSISLLLTLIKFQITKDLRAHFQFPTRQISNNHQARPAAR